MSRSFLTIGYGGTADDVFNAARLQSPLLVRPPRSHRHHRREDPRRHRRTAPRRARRGRPVPGVLPGRHHRPLVSAAPAVRPRPTTEPQVHLGELLGCAAGGLNAMFHHIWSSALCFELPDDERRRWAFMGAAGSSSAPVEPAIPTQCDIRGCCGVAFHRYCSHPFGHDAVVETCHVHELARWEPVNRRPTTR